MPDASVEQQGIAGHPGDLDDPLRCRRRIGQLGPQPAMAAGNDAEVAHALLRQIGEEVGELYRDAGLVVDPELLVHPVVVPVPAVRSPVRAVGRRRGHHPPASGTSAATKRFTRGG